MPTSYITEADARGRLKASFDALFKLPQDQADLESGMAQVEAQVNAYVGKRYTVPVTDAAALVLVRGWALDLFEELAWRRGAGSQIPEKVKDAAKRAVDQLAALAKGTLSLAGASAAESADAGAGAIVVDGAKPQFRRDDMEGY